MKRLIPFLFAINTLVLLFSFGGCGGGGGGSGSGFIGAAETSISASPSAIDTGDRTEITVHISQVNKNGIALKLRYPPSLQYVVDSSLLIVNSSEVEIAPTVHNTKDSKTYLVYYIPQSNFGTDGKDEGDVTVFLEGASAASEAKVEVDADVDDPLISNDSEFNIDEPEFAAEDEATLEIQG